MTTDINQLITLIDESRLTASNWGRGISVELSAGELQAVLDGLKLLLASDETAMMLNYIRSHQLAFVKDVDPSSSYESDYPGRTEKWLKYRDEHRATAATAVPAPRHDDVAAPFCVGDRVQHKFGSIGTVKVLNSNGPLWIEVQRDDFQSDDLVGWHVRNTSHYYDQPAPVSDADVPSGFPARGSNRPGEHQGDATIVTGHDVDEKRLRYPEPEEPTSAAKPGPKLSKAQRKALEYAGTHFNSISGECVSMYRSNQNKENYVTHQTAQSLVTLGLFEYVDPDRDYVCQITDAGRAALAQRS